MKTVNIKGKEYVMVNERIKEFRKNHQEYTLRSEIIELTPEYVIIKATIEWQTDGNTFVYATGHAMEEKAGSFINKTSYVENCETSAWGRALGNFGIGIDASIASADEVGNAIKNQKTDMQQVQEEIEWDKDKARKSYDEYLLMLTTPQETETRAQWEEWKKDARKAAKDDQWATSWIETFKKNVDKKEKELFNE